MNSDEARRLATGHKVHAFNGRYVQRGKVVSRERDGRGWWVTFDWVNARGATVRTRKRHASVHVGWPEESEADEQAKRDALTFNKWCEGSGSWLTA